MEALRYPIDKFKFEPSYGPAEIASWINQIAQAPTELKTAIEGLAPDQLNMPYRPEGWRVREVVHHLADAHMSAYIRFKLALTENNPSIKPFQEQLWTLLSDYDSVPADVSVTLLDALHTRWTALLRSMNESDFERTYRHPESGEMTLAKALQLYAWHGRHHIAHITALRERTGM